MAHPRTQPTNRDDEIVEFLRKTLMPKAQTIVTQPDLTPITIDPTPIVEHGDSPTAIILAIAILLWVLRPLTSPTHK